MSSQQFDQLQQQAGWGGQTDVVVVGSGPCGLFLARLLQQLVVPAVQITILERSSDANSNGSPLSASCATRLVSRNVSETATNSWFMTMQSAGCIEEEDDASLSSTRERPRGWSRLSGQWKHYRSPIRENLFAAMRAQTAGRVTLLNGKAVDSLNIGSTGLVMQVNTQLGQESIPCPSTIVLAVPVHEALRITELLPLPPEVRLVLQRRCDECEQRFCRTIRVGRATLLGRCLFEKFQAGKLRELDVSATAAAVPVPGVFLLALADDLNGREPDETCESLHVDVHVHSDSSDALGIDKLASWLALWLSLDERECHSISPSSAILAFLQSRPSAAPLSPLREQGCIVLPICRDESSTPSLGQSVVVLCGDWAVAESGGTVSGALLSAHKAALLIASIAGRCAS